MRSGRRRHLGLLGGLLAASGFPCTAFPQQPGRVYRFGVLGIGDRDAMRRALQPFLGVLAKAGFVEGSNLEVVLHVAPSDSAPLDPVAAQLVAENPDVIFVASPGGAAALKRATSTIPIVILVGFDPVAAGLVTSLARPGANITGVSLLSVETGNKRVELIKEIFPGARRVHYLNQKANMHFNEESRRHARRLGMEHDPVVIESASDLEEFFARPLGREEVVSVATSNLNYVMCEAIVAHANRTRAQIIYPFVECVERGGLVAYAGDFAYAAVRAMNTVARIFKGDKPAEIAFEQVSRVVLVVNLRTAKQIGVSIPQAVLLRADRVIE